MARRFFCMATIAGLLAAASAAGSEWLAPGGAATAAVDDPAAAFARPVGDLPDADRDRFALGTDLFYRRWIRGPAPPPALTGLGPLYNALSCQQCHENDGRGRPPATTGAPAPGFVLKFEPADPAYGRQLQDHAVGGVAPEGQVAVRWTTEHHGLAGGFVAPLRRPAWSVAAATAGPAAHGAISGRIAPPVAGVGLLEAIPAEDIAAAADPDDRDGDGVSGRLPEGRFGWRADAPTVAAQTMRAFEEDMGLEAREIPEAVFDAIVFYTRNLGPPERPPPTPEARRGERLFAEAGCAACHTPSHRTRAAGASPGGSQTIWPYTDLLLHDMGPDLADAGSAEWRTAPLWGLGRNRDVNGNAYFLHDGRARSYLEAVLWHGGEAAAARDALKALPPSARADLLAFLDSL